MKIKVHEVVEREIDVTKILNTILHIQEGDAIDDSFLIDRSVLKDCEFCLVNLSNRLDTLSSDIMKTNMMRFVEGCQTVGYDKDKAFAEICDFVKKTLEG